MTDKKKLKTFPTAFKLAAIKRLEAGEAVLTRAHPCGRRSRVVLTPRRWRQVGGRHFRRRSWQTSPVTKESAEQAVKTIARGMPGDSGATCGD